MATDKLEMALKNAIKTTSDFCEFRGIKRLTVEGIWLFDENDKEKEFIVAVNHKAVQISEWSVSFEEETCNFSVFEVHVRKDDGSMEALYDGSGWTDRETLVCDFVSWGDFTNEIARMWLSQIYLGTEPEEARDECLKAMGVKTEEDGEQETAEVPSEAPVEPEAVEEEVTMKVVDQAVHDAENTTMSISNTMDWMAKDLSKLEATILATGDESLIWYFNRCVRRTERVKARADKMSDTMNDVSFFTREEAYKSA